MSSPQVILVVLVHLMLTVDSQDTDGDTNQILAATTLATTSSTDNETTKDGDTLVKELEFDPTETNSTTGDVTGDQTRVWENTTFNTVSFETGPITTETAITPAPTCDRSFCNGNGDCSPLTPLEGNVSASQTLFGCFCDRGYVGSRCETKDFCPLTGGDVDHDTIANTGYCSGGACVYSEDMEKRFCACFQGEFWDEEEEICKGATPPCFPNPCYNGGTCHSTSPKDFNCSCPRGYAGSDCSYEYLCGGDGPHHLLLESGSCGGSGICKLDAEKKTYFCDCGRDHYFNPTTMSCALVNRPCEPDPCSGHGSCSVAEDGSANCSCHGTYSGERCQIEDLCVTDGNGTACPNGECKTSDDGRTLLCGCDEGYFLDEYLGSCKAIRPPCEPNPCFHQGVCQDSSDGDFNCTCPRGFFGDRCNVRDRCALDGGIAFCREAECVVDAGGDAFSCRCPNADEYFDYRSRKCEVADYCPLISCGWNQVCRNSSCVCADGFKLSEENGECEADFCGKYGCPSTDMMCLESSSPETPEDITCSCKQGHSFNGKQCVPAFCVFPELNNCKQLCNENADGPSCDCEPGFSLNVIDNSTCVELITDNNQTTSACLNSTCSPGSCIQQQDGLTSIMRCVCPPGYVERDGKCLDMCTAGLLPRGICPGDKCVSSVEDGKHFRCSCGGRFQLSEDGITCAPRKMCKTDEVGWSSCSQIGARCVEEWAGPDGYRCDCPPGTEMVLGKCEEICGNSDHQVECSKFGAICGTDHSGSQLKCRCPPGFSSSDRHCNSLARYSYITNLPVSAPKYKRSRRSLDADVDLRNLENDIFNSMNMLFETFAEANVLRCQSASKETVMCKIELQFNGIDENAFSRIYSSLRYNETISPKHVLLPPSLVLSRSDDGGFPEINFYETSHCDEDIKFGTCGSETFCHEYVPEDDVSPKRFTCTCSEGFRQLKRVYPVDDRETYIEVCRDIDECSESVACPDNSLCTNTIGSYQCSCLDGYRRAEQSDEDGGMTCVELCNPNPCIHGECDPVGEHGFQCTCEAGYGGYLCDFEDKNYKAARVRTIIVGAVLGGILLVAAIIFMSTISRMRRKKQLDDPNQMLYGTEMMERRPVRLAAANAAFERD